MGNSYFSFKQFTVNQDYVSANIRFDLMVSNPPYFIDSLKNPDPAKSKVSHIPLSFRYPAPSDH